MKPDDYLTSGGEVPNLTPEEIEAAIQEDPEGFLITNYLTGSLPPDEARAVEARLRDDPAFYERVGGIIMAWKAWPTASDFSLPEEELATEQRRFREDGARILRAGARAPWERDAAEDERSVPRTGGRSRRRAREAALRQMQRRMRRWQLAAGIMGVVLLPAAIWGTMQLTRPVPTPTYRVASPVGGGAIPVQLGDQGMAMVDAEARLIWHDSARINGLRELFLDGGAQFYMRRAKEGLFVIVTPSARITVMASDFRVTSGDPGVTEVQVQHGWVLLGSRGGDRSDPLEVQAGERGRAGWSKAPVRVY